MSALFEVKPFDREYYEVYLKDFIPANIIDIHTHVWLDKYRSKNEIIRSATWPWKVARDNSIKDLMETYELMFPDKNVTPLIFSSLRLNDDIDGANEYVSSSAKKYNVPALVYASPEWSGNELERRVLEGGFYGCKAYLNLSKPYIPQDEIRIFDFLPHHQLEVLNKYGWVVMLHIPRRGRLKDPVNLAQINEILSSYPRVKIIIAHVGRAYCSEDVGDAFEVLPDNKNLMFDFSANSNAKVFEKLIKAVGSKRILFGSDLPILRMRARRICENGLYVNIVPKGMYGDLSGEKHMREVEGSEAEKLTFFMYEEIHAFKTAAEKAGLSKSDVEDIFYKNAMNLLNSIKPGSL